VSDQEPTTRRRLFDLRDFLGLTGLGLLSYGCWLIYPPSAFIVSGVILIATAIALARA